MDLSSAPARTLSDPIGPVAGSIELESPKRSPSESVSGPVESVLKIQAAALFEVGSGRVRTRMDPNESVAGPIGSQEDRRPAIK